MRAHEYPLNSGPPATSHSLDQTETDHEAALLKTMRDGLALATSRAETTSVLSRLRSDIDTMWLACREVWDSIGETEEDERRHELKSFRRSGRSYQIRASSASESSIGDSAREHSTPSSGSASAITTQEKTPHVGSTLAASIGSSVASLLPTVLVGVHSVYSTLVQQGAQVALPQYVVRNGQMVIDHYSVLVAPQTVQGWYPHSIVTISFSAVPAFAATFALAHALDSVHSYTTNRCSLSAAVSNVLSGAVSGTVVGGLYYGIVSAVGIAHAPIVSSALCLAWLTGMYLTKPSCTSTDLAVGATANIAGMTAFLLTGGNAALSLAAALSASAVAGSVLSWLRSKWAQYLTDRLCDQARRILQTHPDASRSEIESAFRKMAKVHHPDKSGDRTLFELAQVSKEILLFELTRTSDAAGAMREDRERWSIARWSEVVLKSFVPEQSTVGGATEVKSNYLELPTDYLDSPD